MADDTPPTNGADTVDQPAASGSSAPRIVIMTQYVKDLSFENPRAPVSLVEGEGQPHGDVAIQVRSRNLGNDNYEILLEFNIEAKKQGEVSFVAELVYGGVFTVSGFDEEMLELATLVECPRILFPFARRIIADSVRDGGFAPLLLSPIDFLKLYQDRNKAQAASQTAKA
jgi:preprotein translocase subunit SecB